MTELQAGVCMRGAWLLIAALQLGACADDDPGGTTVESSFDTWCGKVLCDWDTDRGQIEPVPTWHTADLGVSFVSTSSQISQLLTTSVTRCFLFDMIARVETEARLVLRLDFNDDQLIDFEQLVPDVPWETWPFVVQAPIEYDGVRFILHKQGEGLAVVAQLRVLDQGDCAGDPLTLQAGSPCQSGAVCKSGSCAGGLCQQCAEGACADDPVTSLAPPGGAE